ncbi:MAG: winged helix-turn-helix transcriptional regulator [Acidimicrobiales bacterium]
MASYRQYCPIARATEILAERWSLLIVRNLMFGATTFSTIAQGVPTMSRSMLTKRLRELEHAGVLASSPKPNGQGSTYALTDAGRDLVGVVDSLGQWAETWVEVLPEHTDPGFALWAWCQVQLNRDALPEDRTVVHFEFPDERAGNRFFWLLVQDGDAEVCVSDPGGEPALRVVARSAGFVDWHRGALSWSKAVRSGQIVVTGTRSLVRSFPTWNTRVPMLAEM